MQKDYRTDFDYDPEYVMPQERSLEDRTADVIKAEDAFVSRRDWINFGTWVGLAVMAVCLIALAFS